MRFHGSLFFIYSPSLLYQTAKRPTACGTKALSSPKKPNVRTGNISNLRTASVCFIQEEPHNIPRVLNGAGRIRVIGACPVTTNCIVAMSYCENSSSSRCYSSSSAENAASQKLCAQRHVYTRTAVVVLVDARNEVPGTRYQY